MPVLSFEKRIVKNDALRMSLHCHKQGKAWTEPLPRGPIQVGC